MILAIEPSPKMCRAHRNGRDIIGCGDMIYKYLNYIIGTKINEADILFNGVELVLWKGRNDLTHYTPDNIRKSVHNTILAFAQSCIHSDSDSDKVRFIKSDVAPLSTGKAISFALDRLKQDGNSKTLLFVLSDDPAVFSVDSLEDLDVSFVPDLTVFIVSEVAVAAGCGMISEFNNDNGVIVYDLPSWYRDFAKTLISNQSSSSDSMTDDSFNDAIDDCIEKKRGVCYGLYGIIKDALGVNHTHGKNM